MSRLTWVQPPTCSPRAGPGAAEGKDVADVAPRWSRRRAATAPRRERRWRQEPATRRCGPWRLELLDELAALPGGPRRPRTSRTTWDAIQAILAARRAPSPSPAPAERDGRVLGAWPGRAAGCLLGKPVEKIPRAGHPRRSCRATAAGRSTTGSPRSGCPRRSRRGGRGTAASAPTSLAENIDGMPEDDDLNFPLLALDLVERHGTGFTTDDVRRRVAGRTCRPAGSSPPSGWRTATCCSVETRRATATCHNPFREWIGAQIRADLYGWIDPGDPRAPPPDSPGPTPALSHVRNGVYGAMCAAAACAQALVATVATRSTRCSPPGCRSCRRRAGTPRRSPSASTLGRSRAVDRAGPRPAPREYGHLHWVHVLNNAALIGLRPDRQRRGLRHRDHHGRHRRLGHRLQRRHRRLGLRCARRREGPAGALDRADAQPGRHQPARLRRHRSFDGLAERTLALARSRGSVR